MTHGDKTYGYSDRHARYDRGYGRAAGGGFEHDVRSAGERFLAFLRTRTVDQWFFFLAGLVIGLVLG